MLHYSEWENITLDYNLNLALENNVELHFANKYCKLRNKEDLNKIKFYLNFAKRKKGAHSWEV